jgi:hypothetical protein
MRGILGLVVVGWLLLAGIGPAGGADYHLELTLTPQLAVYTPGQPVVVTARLFEAPNIVLFIANGVQFNVGARALTHLVAQTSTEASVLWVPQAVDDGRLLTASTELTQLTGSLTLHSRRAVRVRSLAIALDPRTPGRLVVGQGATLILSASDYPAALRYMVTQRAAGRRSPGWQMLRRGPFLFPAEIPWPPRTPGRYEVMLQVWEEDTPESRQTLRREFLVHPTMRAQLGALWPWAALLMLGVTLLFRHPHARRTCARLWARARHPEQ